MSALVGRVTYTMIDNKGRTSSTNVYVPVSLTDIVGIGVLARDLGQLIANITTAQITSVSVCIGIDLSGVVGLRNFALTSSDVAEKIQVLMSTDINTYSKMVIPTAAENFVVSGTDRFDQTATEVQSLITILEDGFTTAGGFFPPVDLRGNDITSVDEVRETFRKFSTR